MDLFQRFDFELPTRIEYGPDVADRLGSFLDEFEATRVFVVSDAGVRRAGILSALLKGSGLSEREVTVFENVSPNPKDFEVEKGAQQAGASRAEVVVAVGGGSVLDCAKALSVIAPQGGRARDYDQPGSIGSHVLPVIAVPTTAGSGSEVTFSAVITDSKAKYKFTLKSPRIAPRIALLDPGITRSMPRELTAATGMDALTHAVEAYTSRPANVFSDAFALQAISLITSHLVPAASRGDDLEARAGMLLGSVLAGVAFSHSDVGAVHCIAEAMGGLYDAPHGACNAVVLPEMMAWNRDACPGRYARIARAMGIEIAEPAKGAEQAVNMVRKLAVDLGLPGVRDLGLRQEDFTELARRSFRNGSNASNPRVMTESDYIEVLQRLW